MLNIRKIQTEQYGWQNWNFPNGKSLHTALGIAEEIGELAHAVLAVGERRHDIYDAVGDIAIYMLGLANREEFDIQSALREFPGDVQPILFPYVGVLTLTHASGKLMHAVLKREQGIRGRSDRDVQEQFVNLWRTLIAASVGLRIDFEACVTDTWNEVRKRDWRQNSATGAVK